MIDSVSSGSEHIEQVPQDQRSGQSASVTRSDDGGAAFPIPLDDRPGAYPAEPGMTLRDYFAAMSLQGILAQSLGTAGGSDPMYGAVLAYNFADAMLKARGA